MQSHALDQNRLTNATEAEKRKDYTCPECGSIVRLRAGAVRTPHFYHPTKSPSCRLAKKGIIHLLLQQELVSLLQKTGQGAEMEKRFPQIDRIADVYAGGTVYEIQYSPMSLIEAKERTQDYESIGLQIVWILHDHTYNQERLKDMERFLRSRVCYYASHNELGQGVIYDQLPRHPVNLARKHPLPKRLRWPESLRPRAQCWSFYHEGDLFDRALKGHPFPKNRNPFSLKRLHDYLYSLIFS